ncbi:GlcG/HbpS family heme-binding protein [Streptosporangium jomthongense]|uniref:Heme-binding protein n=1 Tax=Streptosporangium jomthongense TaxID=1193683 RepID=A0ABV8F7W5_9ACTN
MSYIVGPYDSTREGHVVARELRLDEARAMAEAALARAAQEDLRVSVAVVDALGRDVLVVRGDGATWFTPEVARCKARTAAAFRRDSADLAGLRENYPEVFDLAGDQLPFRPTTLAGGLLLEHDGDPVGAIGVSGATPAQDVLCAEAGVIAFPTR